VKGSGLALAIKNRLGIDNGSVDVAICNPPYLKIKHKTKFKKLLLDANLRECINLKRLTSDILFLAQNLLLLRYGGELGIILPDSLITGHEFQLFRETLLKNHKVKAIIQLPDKVFMKTEARTHILYIEKGGVTGENIPIYNADFKGDCSSHIHSNKPEMIKRMDFAYHSWLRNNEVNITSLKSITTDIKRGGKTYKELRQTKQPYFHTTCFKTGIPENIKNSIGQKYKHLIAARKGDILFARVGKRCVGKVIFVDHGRFLISDCIYRIRVPKEKRKIVFKALSSKDGKKWVQSFAHGVCSQVISKTDLLDFPV
jgi:type I restriction enzyme M protein